MGSQHSVSAGLEGCNGTRASKSAFVIVDAEQEPLLNWQCFLSKNCAHTLRVRETFEDFAVLENPGWA